MSLALHAHDVISTGDQIFARQLNKLSPSMSNLLLLLRNLISGTALISSEQIHLLSLGQRNESKGFILIIIALTSITILYYYLFAHIWSTSSNRQI